MRTAELFTFIKERHAIHTRRTLGLAKPWTHDPILQSYRFCNVYRELDTVTQWIAKNWREPHAHEQHVWFPMVVARLVNWPDTLQELDYPDPWNPKNFQEILNSRKASSQKVFTGAYMIPAGHEGVSKAMFLAANVLQPMWVKRDYIYSASDSLANFQSRLIEFNGLGSFLAGQVVCDTKYTRVLEFAPDWWTFAVEGPGSKRGLNRVMDRPILKGWKKGEWLETLTKLKATIDPLILEAKMPPLHAQDLQNCLCEFDKYERVRLGEGRPRNLYAGGVEL